jgi:hypothetical protein
MKALQQGLDMRSARQASYPRRIKDMRENRQSRMVSKPRPKKKAKSIFFSSSWYK